MIKELRKKFMLVAMCSMFVVLAVIMGIFQAVSYLRMADNADRLTEMIAENDGTFPDLFPGGESEPPGNRPKPSDMEENRIKAGEERKNNPAEMSPETPYETRYFSVTVDKNGNVGAIELKSIAAISEEKAANYAKMALADERSKGFEDVYRYRCAEKEDGILIIFLDCHNEWESFWNNMVTMSCVSAIGLLAVFILIVAFSNMVFRPVAESYNKQKRFITDASHEIKTPLTIIDANIEVIEMENGASAWTKSIRNQVKRLTLLTQQMITLSRLDEECGRLPWEEFSLTDAVNESAAPFFVLADKNGKRLLLQLEEGISFTGARKDICQLVRILLDNAIKYSIPDSCIEVSLERKGKKIYLKVFNQTEEIPKGNLDILFERFFLMDSSRNSETNGSGIGLSIARAIMASHKGKISAYSADGKSITVTVEFK